MSINSGYGGNVLQGKKCFALRIASNLGRQEGGWLSTCSSWASRIPRARCGMSPAPSPPPAARPTWPCSSPEGYQKTAGNAGAWGMTSPGSRVGADGRLWAVNPEKGFFGVAPGPTPSPIPTPWPPPTRGPFSPTWPSTWKTTPSGGRSLPPIPPQHALDWKGNPWSPDTATGPAAHPNSRFTAPAENCPASRRSLTTPTGCPSPPSSSAAADQDGPLVYQSRDWQHGVFVGSVMASEKTAAAEGTVGETRRDPMAMLPLLRLPHGGLLAALAGYGEGHCQPAENLQRQLVPHR